MIVGCIHNVEEEVELRSRSSMLKSIYSQRRHLRISIHSYRKALGPKDLPREQFLFMQELLHRKISLMNPQEIQHYNEALSTISKLLVLSTERLNLKEKLWKLYGPGICPEGNRHQSTQNLLATILGDQSTL